MISTELVEAVFYKKINPGDLLNIDFSLHPSGGGQTYLDLAGISEDMLCHFLEYGEIIERAAPPFGDTRQKFGIMAIAIGTDETKLIEFDPRNNRPNYKLSDQRANRHPAWTSRFGFPHAPDGARYAQDVTNTTNLLVYIIRTSARQYYAGFVNSPSIPATWPIGVGLERLFEGERRGVYFLDGGIVELNNNATFPFSIVTTVGVEDTTMLPTNIAAQVDDAVEYLDDDITVTIDEATLSFREHAVPIVAPVVRNANPPTTNRRGRHINQARAQRNRMAIGNAGEQAIVHYEVMRLTQQGRPDLASQVEWVSQTQGDGLGYDIRSYNISNGIVTDQFLEVKTTTGSILKPFDISTNEISFSEEHPDSFVIFRIFEFRINSSDISFYCVGGAVREHFNLSPTSFLASPNNGVL